MVHVKDSKGLYEIKFDSTRRISYEKNSGFWHKEDIERYHDDYVKKVSQEFNGKPWAVCCDLRGYKTSNIGEEMEKHTQWKINSGMCCAAIIVSDTIVKMQLNRASGGKYPQMAFTNEQEADEWLRSKGF
ncbi:MAG TPA: hypothetical protein PK604_03960 [Acetivibrio clariflavus]|nr:hypothetical protein [Acetivibrio clariflavus]